MKIGFRNLRSLKDTGLIDIKPITFLLGQNSSGKSTFLRSFPLLRQSVETKTKGPILWYGGLVDFGDFNTAVFDKVSDKFIEFQFEIEFNGKFDAKKYFRNYAPIWDGIRFINNCQIYLTLKSIKEYTTYTSSVRLVFNGFEIKIEINNDQRVEIFIDGINTNIENLLALQIGNGLIPTLVIQNKERLTITDYNFQRNEINQLIKKISKRNYTENTINQILGSLIFSSNEAFYNSITQNQIVKLFGKNASNIKIDSQEFQNIKCVVIPSLLPLLLDGIDTKLSDVFKSVYYVAPLRATAERYYRPQELNVDEVDFQGKNLALVLANLTDTEKSRFKEWCLENFDFYPEANIKGGNISIYMNVKDESSKHNITDLGFGFSQILPVIVQIWTSLLKSARASSRNRLNDKIYVIEQPELHLHPKLQGKLVDSLIGVINYCNEQKINVKFIIETHSETLINSIGNRIYFNKIEPKEVSVLIFNRVDDFTKVDEVKYEENGVLKNWPYGFFEEDLN
jgi:AAA15 family ATPase/GTPase